VAWAELAKKVVAQYIHKGSQVYVAGRLQTRSWDDRGSGKKMYRTEIIANEIVLCGERDRTGRTNRDEEAESHVQSKSNQTRNDPVPDDDCLPPF
jgi:single-strand DNA-binding protein